MKNGIICLPCVEYDVAAAIHDDFPRVRLGAVRAATVISSAASVQVATGALDKPMDPVLDYGLWLTCNELAPVWVPAFESGKLPDWKPSERNYALRAVKSPAAMKVLVNQLKAHQLNADDQASAIDLLADIGGPEESAALFDLVLADVAMADRSPRRVKMLAALTRLASRKVAAPPDSARVGELLDDSMEPVRAAAMRLAGAWKVRALSAKLEASAGAETTSDIVRLAAIDGLARMGDDSSRQTLRKLSAAPTPSKIRRAAIGGLAAVDMRGAVKEAAEMLTAGDEDPGTILSALLGREGAAAALATALRSATIPADTAKLSLRYLQGSTTQDARLMGLFAGAIGSTNGPTKLTADKMKETIDEVVAKGDAANGERVFRRADTNCYQCHSIAGAGGWLAPDLSSIGAAAQMDYLINAVLDPGKDIKDGFDGYLVVTKSGEAFSGIKVSQDSARLVLRDNAHQEIPIPLADVKSQKSVGSLMPTGLADPLTHQEFLDLVRFLSELGKPGAYGPRTTQFIRKWQVADAGTALSTGANWPAVYAMVSGVLPVEAIVGKGKTAGYARGEIEVTSAGKIRYVVNNIKGAELWVDGKPVVVSGQIVLDLARGVHELLFRIDSAERLGEGLSVEITDVPGSAGHAQGGGGR